MKVWQPGSHLSEERGGEADPRALTPGEGPHQRSAVVAQVDRLIAQGIASATSNHRASEAAMREVIGDRTVDEMAHAWVNITYLTDEELKEEQEKRKAASSTTVQTYWPSAEPPW